MEIIWKQILRAAAFVVLVGTLVGIFYLPKNISDLPEAYDAWKPLMPERETALAWFAIVAVIWIGWMGVRPAVVRWWSARKKHPLSFQDLL